MTRGKKTSVCGQLRLTLTSVLTGHGARGQINLDLISLLTQKERSECKKNSSGSRIEVSDLEPLKKQFKGKYGCVVPFGVFGSGCTQPIYQFCPAGD